MKYHMLGEPKYRQPKRRGRGIAAGSGKTCGRGTKGQNSRSSGPRRPGFEGGQTPLHMRLPKLIGFKSHRMPMQIIKTSQLGSFQSGAIVNSQTLEDEGLIENRLKPVKLLFDKEIGLSLNVSLDFCSRKAQNAIESAGGSFKAQPYRPLKDTADKREES